MSVKIGNMSRLRFARLLHIGGVEAWDLPVYPDQIEQRDDDTRYTVLRRDRIDLLSNRFYDSPELWWVIALANGLRLLPNDMYEGQELRIPSRQRVFGEIIRFSNKGKRGSV